MFDGRNPVEVAKNALDEPGMHIAILADVNLYRPRHFSLQGGQFAFAKWRFNRIESPTARQNLVLVEEAQLAVYANIERRHGEHHAAFRRWTRDNCHPCAMV